MKKKRDIFFQNTNSLHQEEWICLGALAVCQLIAIPLKSVFFSSENFSIYRFCSYQSFIIGSILSLYLVIRKNSFTSHESETNAYQTDQQRGKEPPHEKLQEKESEHADSFLEAKLLRADESICFLQKRLEETDEERKELLKKHEECVKERLYLKEKTESMFSLIHQLAHDLKQQEIVLEESRKKHALEIRSLIMRDSKISEEKNGVKGFSHKGASHYSYTPSFQEVSTESALSCLLFSCSQALHRDGNKPSDNLQTQEWPSTAYPNLVKRKLYESVSRLLRQDVGSTSLKNPVLELFLGTTIAPIQEELIAFFQEKSAHLEALSTFQPHYEIISNHLFVFFRCTEEEIDDVILFGLSTKK